MKKGKILAMMTPLMLLFAMSSCNSSTVTDATVELEDLRPMTYEQLEIDIPSLYELDEDDSWQTHYYDFESDFYNYVIDDEFVSGVRFLKIPFEGVRDYGWDGLDETAEEYFEYLNPESYAEPSATSFSLAPAEYSDFVYDETLRGRTYFIVAPDNDTYVVEFLGTSDDIYKIADDCTLWMSLPEDEYNIYGTPKINTSTPDSDSNATIEDEPVSKIYPEGMYKIGTDMPAGEYKLTVTSSLGGYYAILSDSSGIDNIITNDNFDNQAYVTVTDGQYLELSFCQAEAVE